MITKNVDHEGILGKKRMKLYELFLYYVVLNLPFLMTIMCLYFLVHTYTTSITKHNIFINIISVPHPFRCFAFEPYDYQLLVS